MPESFQWTACLSVWLPFLCRKGRSRYLEPLLLLATKTLLPLPIVSILLFVAFVTGAIDSVVSPITPPVAVKSLVASSLVPSSAVSTDDGFKQISSLLIPSRHLHLQLPSLQLYSSQKNGSTPVSGPCWQRLP